MTTTTLRPNATQDSSGYGGNYTTVHGALSDDSNSTYIDMFPGFATLGLNNTITLGTKRVKSVSYTANFSNPYGATSQPSVYITGRFDTTRHIWSIPSTHPPYTDVTSPEYPLPAMTQAELDAMRVSLTIYGSVSVFMYELDVNVTTVDQPVTVLTAAGGSDPYTVSTIVPVSWVNTLDAAGGVQTHYEIKVFDEATYGSGFPGLDLDADTPYFATDVVAGSAQSSTIGPLATADTYRVAVRVAQTFNGNRFWSDWSTDDFTLSLTPPDVSSVAVSPSNSTGSVEVTVTHDGTSPDWEDVEVERSIDGGASWSPVRFATLVDATGDLTEFVVDDYEVPNGTTVSYRARATLYSSGQPVTGAWVASSSTSWSSNDCWLKDPRDPANNTTFKLNGREPNTQTRRVGVYAVVGAKFPVTVSDVRSSAVGSLPVRTEAGAPTAALEQLLEAASCILVQFPASMGIADRYSVVTSDQEILPHPGADVTHRHWLIQYVQSGPPADDTAGAF